MYTFVLYNSNKKVTQMYKNREQPATREKALEEKQAVHLRPKELGRRCQRDGCEHVYTETQECVVCTCDKLWAEAKANPQEYPLSVESALRLGLEYTLNGRPCLNGPHLLAAPLDGGRCRTCAETRANSPRQKAINEGATKYMPDLPCPKCRTTTLKRVDNGQCDGCQQVAREDAKVARAAAAPVTMSARMSAKQAGEKWYTPEAACKFCGEHALKRVDNGYCLGCNPPKRGQGHIGTSTRATMGGVPPDFTIDKTTAKQAGLTHRVEVPVGRLRNLWW
mgnify:CR=1 FL=1